MSIDAEKHPGSPTFPPTAIPQPQPQPQPYIPPYYARIGDPGGLGLFSFASTTLILSLYNLQTRAITHPNVVLGMAIFCGGLTMILAGMWAFPRGDAFSGTVLTSYGAFWLSYAALLLPSTGVLTAYVFESEYRSAFGIYLVVWGIVTFFLLIPAMLQRSWGYSIFLGFLASTYWVWAGGVFAASIGAIKAAGVLGIVAAFVAYYCGISILLDPLSHPASLPMGKVERL